MGHIAHEQAAINEHLGRESSIGKYLRSALKEKDYISLFSQDPITDKYHTSLQTQGHYSSSPTAQSLGISYGLSNSSSYSSGSLLSYSSKQ